MDAEIRSGRSPLKPLHDAADSGRRRRISLPRMHMRTSERKLLLLAVDLVIINAALTLAWMLGGKSPVAAQTLLSLYKWFIRHGSRVNLCTFTIE